MFVSNENVDALINFYVLISVRVYTFLQTGLPLDMGFGSLLNGGGVSCPLPKLLVWLLMMMVLLM